MLRSDSHVIARRILHRLRLSRQKLRELRVQAVVVVEAIQPKSRNLIVRAHVEQPRARRRFLAGAVDRAAAAALRISHRESGQIRNQCAPVDPESLALSHGREVGLSGQAERPAAVAVVAVADRSRKMAAREEVRSPVDSARAGQRLIAGVGPRLVVVRRCRERNEIRVVVVAGESCRRFRRSVRGRRECRRHSRRCIRR